MSNQRWKRGTTSRVAITPAPPFFRPHWSIRHVGFCDGDTARFYRTFTDDFVYDFSQSLDWKAVKWWAECKDVFVDYYATKYAPYAKAFARHLLSKVYRPATLHVRDMENLRFSVARFDGTEKVLMDDLNIFSMEDGRVITC